MKFFPAPEGQTLRHSFEAVARGRYLMPAVIALGVATMTVNESTYQHSHTTLKGGIALTDARVQAAETLQLLTDAGLYARSYILSGSPDEAVEYRATVERMQAVKRKAFELVAEVDPRREVSVEAVEQLVNEHIRSTDEWVMLVARGETQAAMAAAVSSGSRERRDRLREAAATAGCHWFDAYELLGGRGAMKRLAEDPDPKVQADGIHLTIRGYRELGESMLADILRGYPGTDAR